MKKTLWLFISALTVTLPSIVLAAGEINLQLIAQKEVVYIDDNGVKLTQLVDLEMAVPGDTVVYTTRYTNISSEIADSGAIITNQISENLLYQLESATCDNCVIEFSVDGQNFALPEQLTVLDETGQSRPAIPKDFTRVRWILNDPIAPAASGQVSYKAKIRNLSR